MSDSITRNPERLTAEQVTKYLRNHKDFFVENPGLLTEIELPHHSGQAVSLVEKQVSILRERNIEMRQRLTTLLDNARENDRLFDKTKRLVLTLLENRDIASIIEAVYHSFANDFGVHYTRIILFGSNGLDVGPARLDAISNARTHIGKHLKSVKAVSGGITIKEMEFLFDDDAPNVGSAALTVLAYGDIFGVLAVGNQDPRYYQSSMGTLFLSYIGEVLNRTISKHLR